MHHTSVWQTESENQTTQMPVQAKERGNVIVSAEKEKFPKLHQYFNKNMKVKPKVLRVKFSLTSYRFQREIQTCLSCIKILILSRTRQDKSVVPITIFMPAVNNLKLTRAEVKEKLVSFHVPGKSCAHSSCNQWVMLKH